MRFIKKLIIITFFIYIAEFILWEYGHDPHRAVYKKRMEIAKKQGKFFDKRSARQVIKDYRKNGIEAYTVIPAITLAGISDKLTVIGNESGQWATYKSDEHGFNNPKGQYENPDVVILGDSFAQGASVPEGQDIGSHLRKYGYKVLNLGYCESGPLKEYARFKEYGQNAKIVVWIYSPNDLSDFEREKGIEFVSINQAEIDKNLKGYFNRRFFLDAPFLKMARLSALRGLFQELFKRIKNRMVSSTPDSAEMIRDLRDIFIKIHKKIIFVYLSYPTQHEPETKKEVLAMAGELNIPVIDFVPDLSCYPLGIRDRTHYNEETYKLIAEKINNEISKINN